MVPYRTNGIRCLAICNWNGNMDGISETGVFWIMGFWRGVGYFISIIMIIVGLLTIGSIITLPILILGIIFILILKRGASQQRIEKYVKEIRDSTETDEQRKKRWDHEYKKNSDHCVNCGKLMLFGFDTNPLCGQCQELERDKDLENLK